MSGRRTPGAPCWAVTFTSSLSDDAGDYGTAADRMFALVERQPGFLRVERRRDQQGNGVTICYWSSLEAIEAWRDHPEHQAVKAEGRKRWYADWEVRIEQIDCST